VSQTRFTQTTRRFVFVLLAVAFLASSAFSSVAESGLPSTSPQSAVQPTVTLQAASRTTAAFMTQNGATVGGVLSEASDLPHLVLYRSGALTPAEERTLIVEVTGLQVPTAGATVTLKIETQHRDPDFAEETGPRLSVWQASQPLTRLGYAPKRALTALFVHEFRATVPSGAGSLATPTDYFRYEVTVTDADHPSTDPLYAFNQEYAFLMENQWVAQLPEVREASPGAAPDELIVTYCDMFPFRKDDADPSTWLPRDQVSAYVGAELVPRMAEAFRVQSDEWGFSWTDAWTSYRAEDAERLSVALGEGQTWFHGPAPARGDARLSINVRSRDNADYDSLTDALMSTFHHELFHNLQRNLNLSLGGDGRVGGEGNRWKFYSEGTAVLASSVAQPGAHLGPSANSRAYMALANRYLVWGNGRFQDLIADYEQVDPYYAAFYWRFLYEQCGGMGIVRRALTALYAGEIVDIGSSSDLVGVTPEVLDRAFAGSSCPFQGYEESLSAFSRAIYALRIEGGRCVDAGTPSGCGFYDPHGVYAAPSVHTIRYTGATQEVEFETTGGVGTDLIDVILDPTAEGQSLVLEFHTAAKLEVQLLFLIDNGEGMRLRETFVEEDVAELPAERTPDGYLRHTIPEIRTAASNRLGLIVTRFGGEEPLNSVGRYTILLRPDIDYLAQAVGGSLPSFTHGLDRG
jgi:hypothetical protein